MKSEETKTVNVEDDKTTKTNSKVLPTAKLVLEIVGLLASVYVIISYLSNWLYQRACERFYNIRGDFFSTDVRPQIAYIVLSLALLVLFVLPAFGRIKEKRNKENKEDVGAIIFYLILSVVFGVLLGVVNLGGMFKFSLVRKWFEDDSVVFYILVVVVILCSFITIVGLTLAPEISSLKKKGVTICYYVWFVSAYLMLSIYIGQMGYSLTDSIEDKRDYEFVIDAEKPYVVLDDVGDEVLVVEYLYNEDVDEVTFYTKRYYFLPRKEYSYAYGGLSKVPIIEYDIKDDEKVIEALQEE